MGVLEDYTRLLLAQKRGQQTHTQSHSQDKSIEQMGKEAQDALVSGIRQWHGDALGFAGDIADGAYYAGKRILGGQNEKSIPSLGAGAAIRRKLGSVKPRAQAEVASSEEDPRTEAMRFINPLAFVNPGSALKVANTPLGRGALTALAVMSGVPGDFVAPAIVGVLKPKGGNFRKDHIDGIMDMLKAGLGETNPEALAKLRQELGRPELGIAGEAVGKWADTNLRKYIVRDMATEGDPIRRLANEGIAHTNIDELYDPAVADLADVSRSLAKHSLAKTNPGLHIGQAKDVSWNSEMPTAAMWDEIADSLLYPTTSGEINRISEIAPKVDPWLLKADPDTPVFASAPSLPEFAQYSGLDKLVNKLGDSVRGELALYNAPRGMPSSLELPQHLRLTPEQVNSGNFSLEAAVRHVDKINKYAEEQKRLARLAHANNKATQLHKEYPEQGLKWIEFKPQSQDERYDYHAGYVRKGFPELEKTDPAKFDEYVKDSMYSSRNVDQQALQDALDYESEQMRHCVGGYCPDVISGRTKLYSLRDKDERPRATIEVDPNLVDAGEYSGGYIQGMKNKEEMIQAIRELEASGRLPGSLQHWVDDITRSDIGIPSIRQIKGFANQKPDAKYIPAIQDFVKSGQWSTVRDIGNADLRKLGHEEAKQLGVKPGYYTQSEIDDMLKVGTEVINYPNDPLEPRALPDDLGFAEGGLVSKELLALHGY